MSEDGASVILRNVVTQLPDYTVPQRTILNLDI